MNECRLKPAATAEHAFQVEDGPVGVGQPSVCVLVSSEAAMLEEDTEGPRR